MCSEAEVVEEVVVVLVDAAVVEEDAPAHHRDFPLPLDPLGTDTSVRERLKVGRVSADFPRLLRPLLPPSHLQQ